MKLHVPRSLKAEHDELHAVLHAATGEPGELGAAALAVAEVLQFHLLREEEYALPPLALLPDLSQGVVVTGAEEALLMTERLQADLPRMLEEHRQIDAGLERLTTAAHAAGKAEYVHFAEALRRHAQMEEELLYPASLLVGRYLESLPGPSRA